MIFTNISQKYQIWDIQQQVSQWKSAGFGGPLGATDRHGKTDNYLWGHERLPGQASQLSPLHSPWWPWLPAACDWANSRCRREDRPCLPPGSSYSVGQFSADIACALLEWSWRPLLEHDTKGSKFIKIITCLDMPFCRVLLEVAIAEPERQKTHSEIQWNIIFVWILVLPSKIYIWKCLGNYATLENVS